MSLRPFDEVVVEHGPVVLRVCRALLGSVDADDAWSETFLSALGAYPDLRADSDLRGWLVTIAHRKAIDQLRRSARTARPSGDVPDRASPARVPVPPDEALRSAVAALPPKQRAAVAYRYLADLSYADIAGLLACSQDAARRSAADGIAALRRTYPTGAAP